MKKNNAFIKQAKRISFLFLASLISACGTIELRVESSYQMKASTPATKISANLALPSKLPITPQPTIPSKTASPSSTPIPIQTATPLPSSTPTIKPRAKRPPPPIPHFSPGESVTITQIEMFNETTGWAVGRDDEISTDHILTTSDGGYTWRDVTPGEPLAVEMNESAYRSVSGFFLDSRRAIVIFDPEKYGEPVRIWMTYSAGNHWKAITINTNFQTIEHLTFSDDSFGWLMLGVDAGMGHVWIELYRTRDGGGEWELILDPYSDTSANLHDCCKTGMTFSGSNTGLVTFGHGPSGGAFINWTDDGGITWVAHPLPRPDGIFDGLGDADFGFLCESHSPTLFSSRSGKLALECWMNPDASDIVSFIFTTRDGGFNWNPEPYPGGQLLFLNPDVGWALSHDIYQTLDGGQTWIPMSTVQWEGQFSFVSQQLGWAAVRNGEEFALVYTEDGGKFWDLIKPIVVE